MIRSLGSLLRQEAGAVALALGLAAPLLIGGSALAIDAAALAAALA